jgi:hypothetical protein
MACLSGLLSFSSAECNDSLVTVKASGLSFDKTESIQMASEDLTISLDQTRVSYQFVNSDKKDVVSWVAFPLPGIHTESPLAVPVTSRKDPYYPLANPFDFQVWVNGQKIAPELELTHHYMGGPDQETNKVIVKNISGNPEVKSNPGDGSILDYKYFWEQRFPANQKTLVKHSYKTSPGTGVISEDGNTNIRPGGPFCFDKEFIDAFSRYVEKLKKSPDLIAEGKNPYSGDVIGNFLHFKSLFEVRYILSTGANWKGPIGRFKLIIDKKDPAVLISTCFKGLKKVSATRFEAEIRNYLPKEDLAILFVKTPLPAPK